MRDGWIKLHRCILDKPIWSCSTVEQKTILVTILLLANYLPNDWEWKGEKFKCQPGQFVTSSFKLAEASGCSRQNIRTALKRFQDYGFLTYESTKTGILITVVNWAFYQAKDKEPNQDANQQLTNSQPTANQQLTTIKNTKKDKKEEVYMPFQEIVSFLNEKTGKSFRHTSNKTRSLITARINEGYVLEDFYKVIAVKAAEWKDDPKWSKYLQPETLFSNKFESYLNQEVKVKPSKALTDSNGIPI